MNPGGTRAKLEIGAKVTTSAYLNLLRNRIDSVQVPPSDRGSRLLISQKLDQSRDATESPASVAQLILDWTRMSPIHSLRRRVRQNYSWRRILQRDIRPLLVDRRNE
jgi:hypothetical protein